MKLVISGKYTTIDNLIKETEFVNTGVVMAVEYPEAYYYSRKCGKGTVVVHTDSWYLNFKTALKKKFRDLDVCIIGSKCEWSKRSGESDFECKPFCSRKPGICDGSGGIQPDGFSEDLGSLDGYETLDLWEKRVCDTASGFLV